MNPLPSRLTIDAALAAIPALLAEGEAGADPGLREVVEGLSLRARVELARRSMPGK